MSVFDVARMLQNFSHLHTSSAAIIAAATYISYLLYLAVYNVWFHPLSKYPGPLHWAATPIPYVWYQVTGRLPFLYQELHNKFGQVVRVLPNELSFSGAAAWRDIYQSRPGHRLFTKDPENLAPNEEGVYNILTASNPADHARYRSQLNPAFSTRALNDQEPLVMKYVDLLILRLGQHCAEGTLDMLRWANLIYFDIIADLTFGESLHGLDNETYHPWLRGFFGTTMKMISFQKAILRFPHIFKLLRLFMPSRLTEQQLKHSSFVAEHVARRMSATVDRRDFMSYILPYDEGKSQMSMAEVRATYGALMLAGSENVATTLVFTVYHLLTNPPVRAKLVHEIRSGFAGEHEISFRAVNGLKYLSAVVHESMRIHPPAPSSQQRVVPDGGATIAEHWVPGGARVAVPPYFMNHSAQYFYEPDRFIPERWLNERSFALDNKNVFQPFQLGPRACVGQRLALTEVYVVLAKMLWHFDLELGAQSVGWDKDLRIFHLWELQPLFVHLKPVGEVEGAMASK